MDRVKILSYHSAPGALYLFLALWFVGLLVWSFILSYYPKKVWKRVLGLLLSFLPAIIIVGAFMLELTFSPQPYQDQSYISSTLTYHYTYYILPISSTLTYHYTYYILPSVIGYVIGFLESLRIEKKRSRIREYVKE